ncbi:Winged helix-turn helix [uncultured archaeon]|nr:Winged helix-turn helix [uncultured archaeon]
MSWIVSGGDFFEGVSTNALRKAFVSETNVRAKIRLHAAFLRRKGKRVDEIAETLGVTKSAVSKWLNKLHVNGIAAAMPVKQTGRPKRLSAEQLKLLRKDLLKTPDKHGYGASFWETRTVQEHAKKKFGASFVDRHMRRLLHRMGFSQIKPRPSDYRADKAAQKRFKKNSLAWYPST